MDSNPAIPRTSSEEEILVVDDSTDRRAHLADDAGWAGCVVYGLNDDDEIPRGWVQKIGYNEKELKCECGHAKFNLPGHSEWCEIFNPDDTKCVFD